MHAAAAEALDAQQQQAFICTSPAYAAPMLCEAAAIDCVNVSCTWQGECTTLLAAQQAAGGWPQHDAGGRRTLQLGSICLCACWCDPLVSPNAGAVLLLRHQQQLSAAGCV